MLELIVPAPKIVEGNEPLSQSIPSPIKRTLIEISEKRRKLLTIWTFIGSYVSHFVLTIKNSSQKWLVWKVAINSVEQEIRRKRSKNVNVLQ